MHQAIHYHYAKHLDYPPKATWDGRGGTVSNICMALKLHAKEIQMVRKTLENIMVCMHKGEVFDGTIRWKFKKCRKILIESGSIEETLIANWMEAHCGFRFTTELVNEHRRQQGGDGVSRFAIMSAFYCLKQKIDMLDKIQSGGNNKKWAQAQFNVTKKMQVMLGKITVS